MKKGQELIEFALVLPLLLLVAFGVLDLGRLFYSTIIITNAAREGVRYGIAYGMEVVDNVYTPQAGDIINAARREAQASGINLAGSTIAVDCPDLSGCGSGLPLRVTIQYRFNLIIGGILPSSTILIERSAEMMVP